MTRATLLHVLDCPTALGPNEVRELEQLAQAFPYCQTAHLLLAKAAHDQGTMLAGQRLRRAATYAADRTLLRRLIEQTAPAAISTPFPAEPLAAPAEAPAAAAAEAEPLPAAENPTPMMPETGVVAEPEPQPAAPLLVDLEGAQILMADMVGESSPEAEAEAQPDFAAPTPAADRPAQAPAVRPPAEAGAARFEYGLAEAPLPPKPVYELPGLVDEFAASAVTLSMGSSELPAIRLAEVAALGAPFTAAAFTGDATVGYAFGESSRLGLSLQLLDLLTAQSETAECSTAVVAAAQPPAGALPPAGTFFEPDPLLLDYWATHCPPPPPKPSPLDLINNFLRRQPRLTRPSMLPPTPAAQADLSVRSTNAEPDLVSENLARIFLRQGKTARAVEIYEKLMVKHPEKMAYFTAQIKSLQPSA